MEKMIAEVEQHAATLKDETAAAEESSRNRSREELLVEEKKEYIFAREKELAAYEAELKNKALSLEEHSQAITKLEQQVQERVQKAQDVDQGKESYCVQLDGTCVQVRSQLSALKIRREAVIDSRMSYSLLAKTFPLHNTETCIVKNNHVSHVLVLS